MLPRLSTQAAGCVLAVFLSLAALSAAQNCGSGAGGVTLTNVEAPADSEPLLIKLQDAPYGWNVTTTYINSQNSSRFAVKYITQGPSGSVGFPVTSDSGVSCTSGDRFDSSPGQTGLWVEITCRNDPPGICPIEYYIVSHAHDAPPPAPNEPTEPPTEPPTSIDIPVAPVVSPSSSAASIAQSLVLFAMAAALFFNTQ